MQLFTNSLPTNQIQSELEFLPLKVFANANFELFNAENKTYEVKVFTSKISQFQHTKSAACFFDFLQFVTQSIVTIFVTQNFVSLLVSG